MLVSLCTPHTCRCPQSVDGVDPEAGAKAVVSLLMWLPKPNLGPLKRSTQ